jgi:hypothetical protein
LARKTSPFAALTSEQKQMKWMEYQSIRLPYTAAEPLPDECEKPQEPPAPQAPTEAYREVVGKQAAAAASAPAKRPMPPPEVYARPAAPAMTGHAALQQKTRHQQYDAVIARMKQAELRTGSYCSWSK